MTGVPSDTADQRELRSSVRALLEAHAPLRGQLSEGGSPWERLTAEMGIPALAVREEHGGTGATFADLAVALEEAGRTLLRAPLLPTAVAAVVLQDVAPQLVGPLLDGSSAAALALSSTLDTVPWAPGADLVLVVTGDALLLAEQAQVVPLEPLDPTRPLGRVVVAGDARRLGGPEEAGRARDLLHAALAAECVGAAQRCLELTVAHLKTREQFGRPLGSFQALRHRVADLTVLVEAARSSAWYAARLGPDLPVAAPLALATAADAFTAVAGEMIQLHGGIGFTWEHDAHLYFKRAWTTALLHDPRALRRLAFARAHDQEVPGA
ncbi:MAG TPA: acyl-CoA dehydrogenase [Mycobacteriales bacterium]|nr:acyl-CoA dehydrogenase [Mycobacteriales bacterium]